MSYTPGLLVTPRTRYRVTRLLPIPGGVRAAVGDRVAARDVVAATALPGDVFPSNVAARIGVPPADLPECMLVGEGDAVAVGQTIARSPGIFGLMKTEADATAAGTIESVSDVTGQVIVRAAPIPVEVDAYVAGTVARVLPGQGVEIEADVAHVQGIFGVGGETAGPVHVLTPGPSDDLTAARVHAKPVRGGVLVGGGRLTKDAVAAAVDVGAAALVAGGIDDADLRDILGHDLGVAITGTEQIGLSIVITEGFGDIAMAARTFELLASLEGRQASVNGTTQIRAGVLRPEVVVPLDDSGAGDQPPAATTGGLAVGAPLRVIRDPYFGVLGTVAHLPHEPQTLASGSRARVVVVKPAEGPPITVPRANVELIEGQS